MAKKLKLKDPQMSVNITVQQPSERTDQTEIILPYSSCKSTTNLTDSQSTNKFRNLELEQKTLDIQTKFNEMLG